MTKALRLERRIAVMDKQVVVWGRGNQTCRHLITLAPLRYTLAHPDYRARTLEPQNIGRTRRHRIAPHALQAIGAVDPGSGDADQDLARLRLRHPPGRRSQHLRPARLLDRDHGLGRRNIGEHRREFPRS